jgi:hypothetical protein
MCFRSGRDCYIQTDEHTIYCSYSPHCASNLHRYITSPMVRSETNKRGRGRGIGDKSVGAGVLVRDLLPTVTYRWWSSFTCAVNGALQKECKNEGKVVPSIFPAGTDSRFLRSLGIPALGTIKIFITTMCFHYNVAFLNRILTNEFYTKSIPWKQRKPSRDSIPSGN